MAGVSPPSSGITLPADPSKCKVEGPGLDSAEVNQQTHVTVHIDRNDKPPKVTAELKSLVNGSVSQLEGVRKEENEYEIQFSSAVRGRHQLSINVNDQPIAGSPFPVYMNIPPTQLGKPVRILTGLKGPAGVTINSAEEVLVTDQKKISVFDTKGNKLREIKIPTDKLSTSYGGIAADEDGNMYVTDGVRFCFFKLNVDGEVIKSIGKYGKGDYEFSEMSGLAVIGDCVYVCDKLGDRVQVYTKETLEYVKTIGSSGEGDEHFQMVESIAQDELGNMYITDIGNNRVKVYNKQGKFQRSFGQKDNGCLNGPTGVCVSGQFVYVVEYSSFCVSVFTRDGQFVSSFGSFGDKEGELKYSFGACADLDGFIYVCDHWNHRVQVF